jgi:UDP-glucose 4-epimerase
VTTLVVGRGLLGRAVMASLAERGETVHTVDVPWQRPDEAAEALSEAADRAASTDADWRLAWTAGAGVVATPAVDLELEATCLESFLARVSQPPSAMFYASSAGGVYAGSPDQAPFSETSTVRAVSAYGQAKLRMEAAASALATRRGSRVVLGRIANLYGPGQDLSKPQGLVSQLCVTHLTQQPLHVHADLDSLRDYIFVRDAARMVVGTLDRVAALDAGQVVVKILASGQSRSVGAIIGESTRAFRRRPHLIISGSGRQITDLRLRSTMWPELNPLADTPFIVGLRATVEDVSRQMRSGHFA